MERPNIEQLFEQFNVPGELREHFRMAKELGAHADNEAYNCIMRIVETAPTQEVATLALTVAVIRSAASIVAITKAVGVISPIMGSLTERVIMDFLAEHFPK